MDLLSRQALAAREPLSRLLLSGAVALPAACVLGAVALAAGIGGEMSALAGRAPAAARFLALYAAPLLLAAPLWARARLAQLDRLSSTVRALDGAVLLLSLARFVVGTALPFSGHMLFLTYTALVPQQGRGYRLVALALLVETTVFKLVLWRDVRSWSLGLTLGLLAAAIAVRTSRRAAS